MLLVHANHQYYFYLLKAVRLVFVTTQSDLIFLFLADFAEVDILEEADKSDSDAQKFNLEWMVKVIYTIKPSE